MYCAFFCLMLSDQPVRSVPALRKYVRRYVSGRFYNECKGAKTLVPSQGAVFKGYPCLGLFFSCNGSGFRRKQYQSIFL